MQLATHVYTRGGVDNGDNVLGDVLRNRGLVGFNGHDFNGGNGFQC